MNSLGGRRTSIQYSAHTALSVECRQENSGYRNNHVIVTMSLVVCLKDVQKLFQSYLPDLEHNQRTATGNRLCYLAINDVFDGGIPLQKGPPVSNYSCKKNYSHYYALDHNTKNELLVQKMRST